jgi:acyl-coenzyme A thioesterase PaaI-like protein
VVRPRPLHQDLADTEAAMVTAFQDLMVHNHCYGCGPHNPQGLHIKSHWHVEGVESRTTFRPQPFHCAGSPEVVNGGVIASLIDCHAVCTATADAYLREGRAIDSDPEIWYVTASLTVDYRRPTPMGEPVTAWARIVERTGRRTTLECRLEADGVECATGRVLAVRLPPAPPRSEPAAPG